MQFVNSARIKFLALVNFMLEEIKPIEDPSPKEIIPPTLSYVLQLLNNREENQVYVENTTTALYRFLNRHFFEVEVNQQIQLKVSEGLLVVVCETQCDHNSVIVIFVYSGNDLYKDFHIATILVQAQGENSTLIKTFFERPFALEVCLKDSESNPIWNKCIAYSSFWEIDLNQEFNNVSIVIRR